MGNPEEGWPVGSPHTDEFARKAGFKASIVPGLCLMGNITEMLVNFFGKEWYTKGKFDIKYISGGVLHGELVTIKAVVRDKIPEEGGVRIGLEVWMEKEDRTKVAVGTASCLVP